MTRLFPFLTRRTVRVEIRPDPTGFRAALSEVGARFTYAPRQYGKTTAMLAARREAADAALAAAVPDPTLRAQYHEALTVIATSGLMPWQLVELAGYFRRGPAGRRALGNGRRQALAEAAEFLRPASYYEAKPHKAAGDVAQLQEWLAGQGVEVTE